MISANHRHLQAGGLDVCPGSLDCRDFEVIIAEQKKRVKHQTYEEVLNP